MSEKVQDFFRRSYFRAPNVLASIRRANADGTLVFGVSDAVVKRASAAAGRRIRQTLDGMKL